MKQYTKDGQIKYENNIKTTIYGSNKNKTRRRMG